MATRSTEDQMLLDQIRDARAVTDHLHTLVVQAVRLGRIPVREIADAAGVSPQTPLNWAKTAQSRRQSPQRPEEDSHADQ